MKIGIVGLGLMGASFAKTLRAKNAAEIYATDIDAEVMKKARLTNIIDDELSEDNAAQLDMLVSAVYPRGFSKSVERFLPYLKTGAAVCDFCGIKRSVVAAMKALANKYPHLFFMGCHPMAGMEYSGIKCASATLFNRASVIFVPVTQDIFKLDYLKSFFLSLGFGEVVVTDENNHDGMIAYTSQLCHVVSNAFIKNKRASSHDGYSAGSYKDMTRVARMNSKMWAELMFDNRDMLSEELNELIENLQKYKAALDGGDETTLAALLEEGNVLKNKIDARKR